MNDSVKYQLERAEDALRTALKLGAETEDPYLLRNISESINTIKGWRGSSRFNTPKTKYTLSKSTNYEEGLFNLTSGPTYGYGSDHLNFDYNYINTRVPGGMSDDVITFS